MDGDKTSAVRPPGDLVSVSRELSVRPPGVSAVRRHSGFSSRVFKCLWSSERCRWSIGLRSGPATLK